MKQSWSGAEGRGFPLTGKSSDTRPSNAEAVRQSDCNHRDIVFGRRQRGNAVQFQIKGQDYFLAFVEQERRWYVFSPTAQGINRIPVYVDADGT